MSLTLWSVVNAGNTRTHKLLAAATLANVAVTPKTCEYGRENETAECCRNCSPCGRYPVLQTEEGCVFETNAILRHIARLDRSGGFLYGRTPLEGSQVDMWLDFSATELDAAPHRLCSTPSVAGSGSPTRWTACTRCCVRWRRGWRRAHSSWTSAWWLRLRRNGTIV
ncbi:elongation factor 1-gamma (EF-1-gamma), putative [Trypanosoma cruzi]|uniref:Elongation factor 1-gamma (EF-1-gamma), putative n=1 Tax=Trypanosoma cruzi (strain CL Brener) TaxID=353153 RepID=Q4CYN2_TRYCC|nr:elongation factor 1-gamma (EF-1-gamma), putative [Trypanosoma cruzi]EAN85383.1 elongation factor 1-gamma (EF-1-gamma), putative [Trypanosoma cruzi]|eukprot:XP_807234.1 elongation factor 1-gamma (EF-1-gamma) [Trypanosoma cruzi strain CL Brener]